jgi:signal transduction histidine kinase/CheY-like chemotaxis protein
LEVGASRFDTKLYPLLLEQTAKLRELSQGPNSIAEARQQELALVEEGTDLLAATGQSSAQLLAAVDQLGSTAKLDIGDAIGDALSVQWLSTRALIIVVVLSLLTSSLIVWLYVGRNIVRRLTALSDSMLAIAGGSLDTPAAVKGTDEIAAMGRAVEVFRRNTLERDSFASANKYKSRFIAAASHDLRQPLHALNLFVAQLQREPDPAERNRLAGRIEAAVASMNELFESLLDMSKLDAGVLQPNVSDYPVQPLLTRIETTFAGAAREKGLRLRVVPSKAWVRTDFILLERVLLNLVSNAVRYTEGGGVAVGCRRRGDHMRIDVWDTGSGIPEERQRIIFSEFVQLEGQAPNSRGGLGLGLSIVERLARLLDHPIEVRSGAGRGSRFSVVVPCVAARTKAAAESAATFQMILEPLRGKLILVIDDDPLVLDGMSGMLRSWGCDVVAAGSEEAALAFFTTPEHRPDLIISDFRLGTGRAGIDVIERLRSEMGAETPAFLISGDTAPEPLREARTRGYHLLHKPVAPIRLRAMLNQLVKVRVSPAANGRAERRPTIRRFVAAQGATPRPR